MKTFKDLKFRNYGGLRGISFATLSFSNSYGISVARQDIMAQVAGWIRKQGINTSPNVYLVTAWNGDEVCKNHHAIDNVRGYCNKTKVVKVMKQIQELGKNKTSKDTVKT